MPLRELKLNDGNVIPASASIAYGCGTAWYGATGNDGISRPLVDAIKLALETGFTHIDEAEAYSNEKSAGVAWKEAGVPRESIYITTKVLGGIGNIQETIRRQLKELQTDYVDQYLVHSPAFSKFLKGQANIPTLSECWAEMEAVKAAGLAKSIGISNYRVADIKAVLEHAKVKPAVNQIEYHPYITDTTSDIVELCQREGILVSAYAPSLPVVHRPDGPLKPVLAELAESMSKERGKPVTPGQILLKWVQAQDIMPVTTSTKQSRMEEYLDIANIRSLTQEEVQKIRTVGKELQHSQYMMNMAPLQSK
ncbi:uncharacterized protein L969DRAFT_52801 [Mixia osmundae IAM 14324]|uniref:NADP-dependent oxidoreductase domain-containing protein n=1 Tax=Mixia osmundae (strain CBS 9802 / IAM 14324 / JCM 22182 / KY 12970) TaxID=764103 RepID=G7E4Y0_MIXOS|nr:uncharacterized protein L969DRAFT_52801 [Mixia osmundae IAM 14324]KEI37752.1 hypothetical protein L969DRAFT_52801 [Mixia osmundae IAM 14324]GAA97890.1 hypothetical protein E5Q_04570 [Mixia osmundae IAM 14324]